MERKIATFLYEARWINLGLLLVGTALALSQLRYFKVNHNLLDQVDPHSEEVQRISELERVFGRSDAVIVALEAEDIFDPAILEEVKRLSAELERLPHVESMVSLSNVTMLRNVGGDPRAVRVLEAYERGEQSLELLRVEVLSDPSLVKLVISADGSAAAINLFVEEQMRTAEERDALMDSIRGILEGIAVPGLAGFYTGNNPLIVDAIRAMESDMKRYFWMTPLIMGILLVLLFRRGNAVVIPLILIVLTVVWTLGVFFGLRKSLGLATSLLPVLIALVTLSDVIHGMALYYATGKAKTPNRDRIISTMEHLLGACFMTSITTSIGIGSLVTSEVESIRQFGVWAAVGILIAYGLVMTGMPVLLSLYPGNRHGERRGNETFWNGLYAYTGGARIKILGGTLILLIVCGIFTGLIRVEAQVSDSLPEDTPAMLGLGLVDEKLSGIGNLEAVIKGEPGVFEEPWALAEVQKIHEFFQSIPEMNVVISPWSILRDMHVVLEEGEPASLHGIPESKVDVQEYYYMLEASSSADRAAEFVVQDRSMARVSGRSRGLSSAEYLRYFREIEEYAVANLDPRLELHTTGRMKVFSGSVTLLVHSLLSSLSWTLVLIAGLLVVHFRSFKVGLISLLPNLVPVMVPLGMMGLLHIPLTAATVMVSCLAVGLAVDNSIHFLARYRWELRDGNTMEEALRRTMSQTGRAIVIVSLVIAGGFTIFLFSEFAANRYFGLLLAISMLTAPLVDLLLLPILIRLGRVQ